MKNHHGFHSAEVVLGGGRINGYLLKPTSTTAGQRILESHANRKDTTEMLRSGFAVCICIFPVHIFTLPYIPILARRKIFTFNFWCRGEDLVTNLFFAKKVRNPASRRHHYEYFQSLIASLKRFRSRAPAFKSPLGYKIIVGECLKSH